MHPGPGPAAGGSVFPSLEQATAHELGTLECKKTRDPCYETPNSALAVIYIIAN